MAEGKGGGFSVCQVLSWLSGAPSQNGLSILPSQLLGPHIEASGEEMSRPTQVRGWPCPPQEAKPTPRAGTSQRGGSKAQPGHAPPRRGVGGPTLGLDTPACRGEDAP